jgi:hypothetical protein
MHRSYGNKSKRLTIRISTTESVVDTSMSAEAVVVHTGVVRIRRVADLEVLRYSTLLVAGDRVDVGKAYDGCQTCM